MQDPFSWKTEKEKAIEHKIRRAITMAKGGNPDYAIQHPDEVRDAQNKQFTSLRKRVREQTLKAQNASELRARKLVGKN